MLPRTSDNPSKASIMLRTSVGSLWPVVTHFSGMRPPCRNTTATATKALTTYYALLRTLSPLRVFRVLYVHDMSVSVGGSTPPAPLYLWLQCRDLRRIAGPSVARERRRSLVNGTYCRAMPMLGSKSNIVWRKGCGQLVRTADVCKSFRTLVSGKT